MPDSIAQPLLITIGNEYFVRYGLEQFPIVQSVEWDYDLLMNFSFSTPTSGACLVKLWASGRYGFSLPKKVEITRPDGVTASYLYHSRKVGPSSELTNRTLVRIAIAQFLAGATDGAGGELQLDDTLAPFGGTLTQIRPFAPPPPPPRVRPSRVMPRGESNRAAASRLACNKEAA
ncbi:MAG: hypothetical protein EOP92_36785 [Lysobacteraceae bacterium]|nr:MAG: hypothetical protein EOP92_36785 [Xanthomonadaceae bacterium]